MAARKRVGIFFPFADLWTHQRAIHLLARRWSTESEITIVSCDAHRKSPCPAQRSLHLSEASSPESRALVCSRCRACTQLSPSIRYCSIGDYSVPPTELPKSLSELLNFQLDNLPLGRVALYDLLLAMKRAPHEIPEAGIADVTAAISDTTDIYLRMRLLLEKEKFDCLILNNELYAMNAAAALAAASLNIETFNLHLGDFRSQADRSINIRRGGENYLSMRSDLSPTTEGDDAVERQFGRLLRQEYKNRFYRRHSLTYSPRSPRFRKQKDRKILIDRYRASLILSSPDEQYTYRFAKGIPRDDFSQVDVLDAFYEFAEENSSERFLVRLHPRLLSNRRDVNEASALDTIREALNRAPANVDFDGLHGFRPILSVLRQSELVVVSWSSLALDAAALGIPVVLGKKLGTIFSTVAIEVAGPSVKDLKEAISLAERRTPDEHQRHAVDFWLRTWREHRFARALPIRLSPAHLALWLSKRFALSGFERVHYWLRRSELLCSPGFGRDSLELLPDNLLSGFDLGRQIARKHHAAECDQISRTQVYSGLRKLLQPHAAKPSSLS